MVVYAKIAKNGYDKIYRVYSTGRACANRACVHQDGTSDIRLVCLRYDLHHALPFRFASSHFIIDQLNVQLSLLS